MKKGQKSGPAFVRELIEEAMGKARNITGPMESVGGVPAFFMGVVKSIRRGGRIGYAKLGRLFAGHLHAILEQRGHDPESRVRELAIILKLEDKHIALGWFEREFPRCMILIPDKSRLKFVEGVAKKMEKLHDQES
jgi:hypothetical protein